MWISYAFNTIPNKVLVIASRFKAREGKKDERASGCREGKSGEMTCMRACSVTSIETFILALLALLCSSNRPRIESCALSYFSRETGQQSASRFSLPIISLPRQILNCNDSFSLRVAILVTKNEALFTEKFNFLFYKNIEK